MQVYFVRNSLLLKAVAAVELLTEHMCLDFQFVLGNSKYMYQEITSTSHRFNPHYPFQDNILCYETTVLLNSNRNKICYSCNIVSIIQVLYLHFIAAFHFPFCPFGMHLDCFQPFVVSHTHRQRWVTDQSHSLVVSCISKRTSATLVLCLKENPRKAGAPPQFI